MNTPRPICALTLFLLVGFLIGSVAPRAVQAQLDTTRWSPELSIE